MLALLSISFDFEFILYLIELHSTVAPAAVYAEAEPMNVAVKGQYNYSLPPNLY